MILLTLILIGMLLLLINELMYNTKSQEQARTYYNAVSQS